MDFSVAFVGASVLLMLFICPPANKTSWTDNWFLKISWVILFAIGVLLIVLSFV